MKHSKLTVLMSFHYCDRHALKHNHNHTPPITHKEPGEHLITADRAGKHVRGSARIVVTIITLMGPPQRSCYHKLSNLHVDTCHWTKGAALIIRTQVIFDWSCSEQSTQWFLSFSGQTQSHSFIFTSPLKHLWGENNEAPVPKHPF